MNIQLKCILAIFALSAFAYAGDETIGGKNYWRDANGVLHQYLYLNSYSANSWVSSAKFRTLPDVEESLTFTAGSICNPWGQTPRNP